MKPTCFYQPDGDADCFRAIHSRGPWSFEHQHGGPRAALLARAVEKARSEPESAIVRFTVEFLRPVQIGLVRVGVESLKRGRTVECHTARLWSGKTLLLAAMALCLRRRAVSLQQFLVAPASPPVPETAQPYVFPFFPDPVGYLAAVDVRYVSGSWGRPSVTCWLSQRCPLLLGEEPTSLRTYPGFRRCGPWDRSSGRSEILHVCQRGPVRSSRAISTGRLGWSGVAKRGRHFEDRIVSDTVMGC